MSLVTCPTSFFLASGNLINILSFETWDQLSSCWVNGAQRKDDPDVMGGQMAMARTHVPPRRNVKTLLETLAIAHFQ